MIVSGEGFLCRLVQTGVRVFTAPYGGAEYQRPHGWPETPYRPLEAVLAGFSGGALCGITGYPFAVVDVDTKNGGSIRDARSWLDDAGVTVCAEVITPSGGRHYYVPGDDTVRSAASDGRRAGLRGLPGVEVLSTGHNVYLPGTIRRKPGYEGKGYTVVLDRLGDRDDANVARLAALIDHHSAASGTVVSWRSAEPRPPARTTYARAALTSECRAVMAAPRGDRNNRLYLAAFKMRRYVADGSLSEREARDALAAAGVRTGLQEREVWSTIGSGLHQRTPRGERRGHA